MRDRDLIASPASVIFPQIPAAERTICVLGTPRGGTTMLSGILRRLDIFMGDYLDPNDEEDLEFLGHKGIREIFDKPEREADKVAYLTGINALIERRNAAHAVWGWKDPISTHYIAEIISRLRNPHFIFITRDLGAVAQREMFEERHAGFPASHLINYLYTSALIYQKTLAFLATQALPTLLVSYERSLRAPSACATAIAEFVSADVSSAHEAARSIRSERTITPPLP